MLSLKNKAKENAIIAKCMAKEGLSKEECEKKKSNEEDEGISNVN